MKFDGLVSESYVFVWNIAFKVNVYSNSHSVNMRDHTVNSGRTIKNANLIRTYGMIYLGAAPKFGILLRYRDME